MPAPARSDEKDDVFISAISEGTGVSKAAKKAGYSRAVVYLYREQDESFAQRWDDAKAEYLEELEAEADRRAVEGVTKPVFYQGEQCGEVQEYSDTLLMFRMKRLDPAYRDPKHEVKTDDNPTPVKIDVNVVDARKHD